MKNRLKHKCVDEFCLEVHTDQSVVVVLLEDPLLLNEL